MTDLIEQIRDQLYIGNVIALAAYRAPDMTGTARQTLAVEIEQALKRSRTEEP